MADGIVEIVKVAGDGNCFFEAAGRELCRIGRKEWERPGIQCRRFCLDIIEDGLKSGIQIHGLPMDTAIEAATGLSAAEYVKKMQFGSSWDAASWGGFLEASLIAQEYNAPFLIFEVIAAGYRVIAEMNMPENGEKWSSTCCIVWTGSHYDRLKILLPKLRLCQHQRPAD